MRKQHRYYQYRATTEVRYFRVEVDGDGEAFGGMWRFVDGAWEPTVYSTLTQFFQAQLNEPREVSAAEVPGELVDGEVR